MHPRWFTDLRSVVSTRLALLLLLGASASLVSAQAEHLSIIREKLQADFEGIVDTYEPAVANLYGKMFDEIWLASEVEMEFRQLGV